MDGQDSKVNTSTIDYSYIDVVLETLCKGNPPNQYKETIEVPAGKFEVCTSVEMMRDGFYEFSRSGQVPIYHVRVRRIDHWDTVLAKRTYDRVIELESYKAGLTLN